MLPYVLPSLVYCLAVVTSVAGHVLPERDSSMGTVIIADRLGHDVPLMVIGLDKASPSLTFRAEKVGGGIKFRLAKDQLFYPARRVGEPKDPYALGDGDFYAKVGANTVKCRLEVSDPALDPNTKAAPSQQFRFMTGESYLWPCDFAPGSWVRIHCEGPAATCNPRQWGL